MTKQTAPRTDYDAIIIGARCAGAATALLLARHGLKVLVLDKSRPGRDTLSTHALMRGAVVQLHRWGLLEKVRANGTPAVTTTSFHYGDDEVQVAIKPRDGVDGLYAPRRTVLDPILANAACAAGAQIEWGYRLIDLIRDAANRVSGVVVQDRAGTVRRITADWVIGADGVRSTVAQLVEAHTYQSSSHATGVVYGYWAGLQARGYHWYFGSGVSAGAIPTNGGTCVFAGVPRQRFWQEVRFDISAGYHRVLRETSPELANSIQEAKPTERLRGYAGHPSFLRQCWGPGWALVGDAAYFKDPLTAHGITDALRDAELLARAVLEGTEGALAHYQSTRDELSEGLLHITDQIASFEWDMNTLQQLHQSMSDEMRRELAYLASLDDNSAPTRAGQRQKIEQVA